jgi:hypothetical protein
MQAGRQIACISLPVRYRERYQGPRDFWVSGCFGSPILHHVWRAVGNLAGGVLSCKGEQNGYL